LGFAKIKPDEVVVLFPTCARLEEDRTTWIVPIHGWIYEPEEDSGVRGAALGLFREWFGREMESGEAGPFEQRARLFLVDNERGKKISARIGREVFPVGRSGADGHFEGSLRLRDEQVRDFFEPRKGTDPWLPFRVVTPGGDDRSFSGAAQMVGETGFSVISDVDDTVKESGVTDRRELLANTFLREYRPVAGMAEVYRAWAKRGAVFHYVSASPYQLYEPIFAFLEDAGFPRGSVHMKRFRLKDSSVANLLAPSAEVKRPAIEDILTAFPRRKFALIGDSGEEDPKLYADLARAHPDQVVRVLIRDLTGKGPDTDRFLRAFGGLPRERWMVFQNAAGLGGSLEPYSESEGRAAGDRH
jgi:hypothetical protein